MKKLLIALTLSTLMLAGCGVFSSNHAWKEAKQENPLQIPPGMDRPSTTAALSIPPPSEPASPSAPAAPKAAANATQMHLSDDVDTAYKRVGLVLQQGGLGTVTAQDAAQHTYQLSVNTRQALGTSQSFLQKHFSNMQQQGTSSSSGGNALGSEQGGTTSVTLKVAPAQGGGSTVSASGDPQQAMRVISVLSGRLGS
ncbi:MAG TPA: hypothetical protein VFL78_11490 [Rhodanobacteraceae bacterium]|nr:hypothetical protein [Rhodanobacteraceae bacterium]